MSLLDMSSSPSNPVKTTDILIIGGGIAGLRVAIGAAQYGKVIILNKGFGNESTSEYAQGGIAAALGDEEDAIDSHFQDTVTAGCGLCQENAVRVLVEEGPIRVRELIDWGMAFDKEGDRYLFAREGAHKKSRILRAKGDSTGNEIVKTLLAQATKDKNILICNGHFTRCLLTEKQKNKCYGVSVLEEWSGQSGSFLARAVILATGGVGQVYRRTTNPMVSTGDGIAMAYHAGVKIEQMEFVQFHPTALSLPSAPSFLISEAIRGEGAILRNIEGKRFMERYHPLVELAPRDLVTRAVWDEMKHGQLPHVGLDVTHLNPQFVRERFPKIYATCLQYGVDMTRHPIPVAPSAHYLMGGISTDLDGKTTMEGLWAVGEVACTGVHGANRLASNSLLEGLVFGARVAKSVGEALVATPFEMEKMVSPAQRGIAPIAGVAAQEDQFLSIQKELKEIMWNDVGIIRTEQRLCTALKKIETLYRRCKEASASRLAVETANMVTVALLITEASLKRKESIGAHYREKD